MKKLLMAATLLAASTSAANAYVGINLDFSEPQPVYAAPAYIAPQPVYVAPQPVYVERPVYGHPNGYERHRGYDDAYWRDHHR